MSVEVSLTLVVPDYISYHELVLTLLMTTLFCVGAEIVYLVLACMVHCSRLVEVWIPSVIRKGRGPDGFHVYQVRAVEFLLLYE